MDAQHYRLTEFEGPARVLVLFRMAVGMPIANFHPACRTVPVDLSHDVISRLSLV